MRAWLYSLIVVAATLWAGVATAEPGDDFVVRINVQSQHAAREISGVLVSSARVITSARALGSTNADQISVSLTRNDARFGVQEVQTAGQVAILTVSGLPLTTPPEFSAETPRVQDIVTLAWATSQGVDRERPFLTANDPLNYSQRLTGRALGGAIINKCGQIQGIIVPAADASDAELARSARANTPRDIETHGLSGAQMLSNLQTANVNPPVAAACDPAGQAATATVDQARQDAQRRLDDVQREIDSLQDQLASAQANSAAARRLRDQLAKAREEQVQSSAALQDLRQSSEAAETRANEAQSNNRELTLYTKYGAVGAAVLLLLIGGVAAFFLSRARKKSRGLERDIDDLNEKDRARANAPDWVLVGSKGRLKLRGALMADQKRGSVVGRGQSEADVLIDDEKISRKHARFFFRGSAIFIEDMRSLNGTKVNGRQLSPGEILELRESDRVEFADRNYVLERA